MDASHVNSWLAATITRSVEDRYLFFRGLFDRNPQYDWAPHCLFVSQTLVTFKVFSNYRIVLRIPSLVWLSSLKTLQLERIWFSDSSSMIRLFNGCPLLQDLSLQSCRWIAGQGYTISSAMLRRLCIVHTCFDSYDPMTPKVEFDIPRLEYFEFAGIVKELYCNKSSSAPAIVQITVTHSSELALVYSLIRIISNAGTMKLCDERYTLEVCFEEDVVCSFRTALPELPTFGNLSHLEVGLCSHDPHVILSKILQHLLTSSPNLETLVFRKVSCVLLFLLLYFFHVRKSSNTMYFFLLLAVY
ncbi:hypothetical protein Dimus_032227 [Dionaea muscipula]